MKGLTKGKSILVALAMFVIVVLALVFVGAPLQGKFGMIGLLLTELMFLVLAVGGVVLTKASFKEVFPFKIPKIRQIIGTIVLWMAAYLWVIFATLVVGYLFPDSLNQSVSGISAIMLSIPFWARFLIVAVSPAICEEAVHRGFILHYLKPLGNKWVIVVLMGILFGAFHLDPPRFLATGILGAVITYIAIETGNIFYPMLLHFLNNALSAVSTSALEGTEVMEQATQMNITLSSVGVYLIMVCVTPWLFWLGAKLIHPKKEKVEGQKTGTWKKVVACTVVTLVCLIGGIVISAAGVVGNMVFTDTRTISLESLAQTPYTNDFEVTEAGQYMLTAVVSTPEEVLEVVITDAAGNVAHEFTAGQLTSNFMLDLEAGSYHVEVSCINFEDEFSVKPESMGTFSLVVQKM